jgi:branched-chain amino acid transport system ATP-binding protein
MTVLAQIDDLRLSFGGVAAADGLKFAVQAGELLAVIGPNGAGKTTALRLIAGLLRPQAGRIVFDGHDITTLPTHARVRRGLGLTHQIVRPFRSFTVIENVMVAAGHRLTANPLAALFKFSRRAARETAAAILERVGLAEQRDKHPTALPLGQRKRLEVARALALEPKLVMLDEPLAGLSSAEAATMADMIRGLPAAGITVALVEHNLGEVLRVADRIVVLDAGKVIADGVPAEVMAQDDVRKAYMG